MGRPMRSQAGRPAADSERSEKSTLSALCELRLEMGERLGLRPHDRFAPLWVVDFPLLEWDDETQRYYAMHHPFTSPKSEDLALMDTDPGRVRANAYDFVVNGVEVGGGSIRIFDSELQQKMFRVLGFSAEEAEKQFGFLTNAFKYGALPTEVSLSGSTAGARCSEEPTRSATTLPSRRTTRAATR